MKPSAVTDLLLVKIFIQARYTDASVLGILKVLASDVITQRQYYLENIHLFHCVGFL